MAMRHMMKHKSQSAIAIIGLSLSLVCFSACLYITRSILSVDANFPNRDRIVELKIWDTKKNKVSPFSPSLEVIDALHRQEGNLPVVRICSNVFGGATIRDYMVPVDDTRALPFTLHCMETDTLYNTFFTPHISYGSWASTASTRNALVLTRSAAERIFGDASRAVGLTFTLAQNLYASRPSQGAAYTVTAVMEDLPLNSSINFMQQIEALTINDSEGVLNRTIDDYGGKVFALVPEGEHMEDFIERINHLQINDISMATEEHLKAYPLGQMLKQESAAPKYAHIALIAGLMVLSVGLLNFFYFLTEAYRMRIREYFVRRVNGAGTLHLVGMLLTESVVYVGIVAFFSIGLIKVLLNDYRLIYQKFYVYIVDADEVALQCGSYLLILMLLCAVVVGLQVIRLQHQPVSSGLTEARGRRGKHPLRNGLLAVQLVISWIFVGLTISLYLQSNFLEKELFGTLSADEKERILSVSLNYRFLDEQQKLEAMERISHCAGIEEFLEAPYEYVHVGLSGFIYETDNEPKREIMTQGMSIMPEFISFMHIPIIQGETTMQSAQILVDSKMEKMLGGESFGKKLTDLYGRSSTVTGRIPTLFVGNSQTNNERGQILTTDRNRNDNKHCYVKCRPGQTKQVRKEVDAVLRDILPESCEPQIRTFMEEIHDQYVLEFKLRNVVLFMAIVTLMIAVLGIYSAITLDTERRQKEMVIRKINGAKVRHIAFLFARMYMVLLVGTAAIAFPLLHVIIKMLSEKYPLHVDTGWLFYTVLFVSVALIVFLTIYRRIRNIAKVNPAEMIKSE